MMDVCGPYGIRHMSLEAGQSILGHKHNFDHVTVCRRGRVKLEWLGVVSVDENGAPSEFTVIRFIELPAYALQGSRCLVRKDTWHRITAIEESDYECWYLHRNPLDGEAVEEWTGWEKAYT